MLLICSTFFLLFGNNFFFYFGCFVKGESPIISWRPASAWNGDQVIRIAQPHASREQIKPDRDEEKLAIISAIKSRGKNETES